jgi:hypothetical protein
LLDFDLAMTASAMRFHSSLSLLIVLGLVSGCASFNGYGLKPGSSTASDVEALMGAPAEKLAAAGGESVWYYPRQPTGLHTYAVRIGPDGVMRGIEQRLTEKNLRLLVPGVTTVQETRALLGPPWRSARNFQNDRDCWDYRMYNAAQIEHILSVQFSDDGLLREAVFLEDRKVSGSSRHK